MRISILSMQRVVNFGSVLQAWSLREMLQELTGEPVTFTDISGESIVVPGKTVTEAEEYARPAAYPKGVLQKAKRRIITKLSAYNKKKIRKFMSDTLLLDHLGDGEEPDLVVVGSDEVFNHTKGINLQLHGGVRGKKKITFAASCGSASAEAIAPGDFSAVRQAMTGFSAVSVRDEATEQYAKALYDGPVTYHLDPVLTGPLYLRKHKKVRLKPYLLVYGYGQRIRTAQEIAAIQNFAHSRGLKTVAVGGSQFWCDRYIPTDPFRLLDYFHYARYVVTDTFHGAVFSVLEGRPFGVIVRPSNENKLTDLLKRLDMEDRRVSTMEKLSQVLQLPMELKKTEMLLKKERTRARAYLQQQLGEMYET